MLTLSAQSAIIVDIKTFSKRMVNIVPDGDILHGSLGRLYRKSYEWLCEGKASFSECAHVLLQALGKDIERKGDLPIKLAQEIGKTLDNTINHGRDNVLINWGSLCLEIEKLVYQCDGRPDLKELTLRATKSLINDLRYMRLVDSPNISIEIVKRYFIEEIVKRYLIEVYESSFKEKIPLLSEHDVGIDQIHLNQSINDMEPSIIAVIKQWAKQVITDGGVKKLKLPRRNKKQVINLEENLL